MSGNLTGGVGGSSELQKQLDAADVELLKLKREKVNRMRKEQEAIDRESVWGTSSDITGQVLRAQHNAIPVLAAIGKTSPWQPVPTGTSSKWMAPGSASPWQPVPTGTSSHWMAPGSASPWQPVPTGTSSPWMAPGSSSIWAPTGASSEWAPGIVKANLDERGLPNFASKAMDAEDAVRIAAAEDKAAAVIKQKEAVESTNAALKEFSGGLRTVTVAMAIIGALSERAQSQQREAGMSAAERYADVGGKAAALGFSKEDQNELAGFKGTKHLNVAQHQAMLSAMQSSNKGAFVGPEQRKQMRSLISAVAEGEFSVDEGIDIASKGGFPQAHMALTSAKHQRRSPTILDANERVNRNVNLEKNREDELYAVGVTKSNINKRMEEESKGRVWDPLNYSWIRSLATQMEFDMKHNFRPDSLSGVPRSPGGPADVRVVNTSPPSTTAGQ